VKWQYWVLTAHQEMSVKIGGRNQKVDDWAVVFTEGDPWIGLTNICSKAGESGWELVSAVPWAAPGGASVDLKLFFKRATAA
jgi:hypothetical protein